MRRREVRSKLGNWRLERAVRDEGCIDQNSLIVNTRWPAGDESDLCVVTATQLEVVFVNLASAGDAVDVLGIGRFKINIDGVFLNQLGDFGKVSEYVALSCHKAFEVSEEPSASLRPG